MTDTLSLLFAWGGDSDGGDPPRIEPPKPKAPSKRKAAPVVNEDDDDDDDELIPDPRDRKIRRLSRENARRRTRERELEEELESYKERVEDLEKVSTDAVKLQKSYDKLKSEFDGLQGNARDQAIRAALSADKVKDKDGKETPRAWYDVDMVLSLLDRDSLAVDLSDGSVGGLSDQLNQLAQEKPFLVKAVSGDQGNGANNYQRPTGSAPQTSAGGNRSQEAQRTERELVDMFPALRNVTK